MGANAIELRRESGELILHQVLKFSGGEIQPKILDAFGGKLFIKAHLTSADDIMHLVLLMDAIRRFGGNRRAEVHLTCPYLPYARQDRVCARGESLAVKVMCDLINSLDFASVTVWDVHSDVSLALLNNVFNVPQRHFVQRIDLSNTILVAPDAGAIKKTLDIAKAFSLPMVRADKVRSVEDGSIAGTVVYSEHVGDRDFLIVDDICDGGRTFIELAKVLKPLTRGRVNLYVTHGIFSKGLHVFDGLIDRIYTANPFPEVDTESLTVL